jgi:hypothetical protein
MLYELESNYALVALAHVQCSRARACPMFEEQGQCTRASAGPSGASAYKHDARGINMI